MDRQISTGDYHDFHNFHNFHDFHDYRDLHRYDNHYYGDKALPRLVNHQEVEGSHVYLSTSSRVAGAIDSFVWRDKEFING